MRIERVVALARATSRQAGLADPVLEIAGLAKRYGASTVFEGVDLVLGAGEFVAVVGESGVGKSTLLNCVAGLDRIDAGTVRVAGTDIHALGESAQAVFRRHHLGFVFQAFHVLPHLSVAANVGLPLLLQHAPDPARVARDARRRSASPASRRACRTRSRAASCSASRSRARSCTGPG